MLSVIIPARNEVYLQKTIESALQAAEGEIEVIAVCDGYWPDPQIQDDPKVNILHYTEPIGQRQGINQGAKVARGKYILKADGHCSFDKGFDAKLIEDCEYDWTMIPRMYNLDAEKWEPKWRKRTDFMWIRSPDDKYKTFRHNYYDGKFAREFPEEYRAFKRAEWTKPDIANTLACVGACFFMHLDRFWQLGGMDEGHGSWGQMGIELGLKAWTSGGRMVTNKRTWFAHQFRGGAGPGFPYKISGRSQEKARKYSRRLWLNDNWPLQKRSVKSVIRQFMPLPHWNV
jgi:glycosyltransferase involved in cell wall biosynthesis